MIKKERLIAMGLSVIMIASIAACSNQVPNNTVENTETVTQTEQQIQTEQETEAEAQDVANQVSQISDISVESQSETIDGEVYSGELETGAQYFAYIPKCEDYGVRPTSNPVLIVYGNEKYTQDSAKETAMSSGLAEIADKEKAPIFFVNPKGDQWTSDDADSYLAVRGMISDSSSAVYDDEGRSKTEAENEDGEKTVTYAYPGTVTRMYVFAEGAGADFAYENLAKGVYGNGQYMGNSIWRPVGLYLLNGMSENIVDFSDVDSEDYEYAENDVAREVPVVIVNGTDAMQQAFNSINSSENTVVQTEDSITSIKDAKTSLINAYNSILEHHITRDMGYGVSLMNLESANELGLVETKETFTASNGNVVTYYQFVPENMDAEQDGSVPFVFGFHGGGNSAENYTWSSGWNEIAGENDFMYVAVDRHVDLEDEIMELLEYLESEYTQIDQTRIYASGFSMGSIKSSLLGFKHDDVFAAISPTNAISFLDAEHGNIVPVFYNAGENSHFNMPFMMEGKMAEIPTTNLDGREAFANLLVNNKVIDSVDDYSFNENADSMFGIAPSDKEVKDCAENYNVKETIRYYDSEDGHCYTVMSTTSNAGHEPIREVTRNAWKFMSQFSRNADGTLNVE